MGMNKLDLRGNAPVLSTNLVRNGRGYWEIRWSEQYEGPDGKIAYRSRTYSTKTKNRKQAEQVRVAWLAIGGQVMEAMTVPTVGDVLDWYEEGYVDPQDVGPTQKYAIKAVRGGLGTVGLDKLDAAAVLDYRRAREAMGRASGTVRREVGALLAALNWCDRAGRLPAGYRVPSFDLPPPGQARVSVLTDAQERLLWTEASADLGPDGRLSRVGRFICLALETAARSRAIETLTWDRVDLARGLIDYRDPDVRASKKRRVPVPISKRLMTVLVRANLEATSRWVLDHNGTTFKAFKAWCGSKKRTPAVKAFMAGIGRHDLRRTWATLAAANGVSLFKIAAVLGDTEETVRKHYAHLQPEFLVDAIEHRAMPPVQSGTVANSPEQ